MVLEITSCSTSKGALMTKEYFSLTYVKLKQDIFDKFCRIQFSKVFFDDSILFVVFQWDFKHSKGYSVCLEMRRAD